MINLLGASAKCLHASTIQVNNDFYYCHVGCWIVQISRLYWKCDLIDDKLIRIHVHVCYHGLVLNPF